MGNHGKSHGFSQIPMISHGIFPRFSRHWIPAERRLPGAPGQGVGTEAPLAHRPAPHQPGLEPL